MPEIKKVLSIVTTTSARLPDLEVKYGQLIFVQDERAIYFDTEERVSFQQIIVLSTEDQRLGITPVSGFYFVEETGVLWRYNIDSGSGWTPLTASPSEKIAFLNKEDFPPTGKDDVLYVSESAIYRWIDNDYVDMSAPKWEDF